MRRLIKFLHEVGSVGLMGAVIVQLILAVRADGLSAAEFATTRQAILAVSEVLLLPSLLLCLVTGLWALAANKAYYNAGWAWAKAATTILVFEGTLMAVQGPAQVAAEISVELAAGDRTRVETLEQVLRHERGGLWVILFLCAANIALAVWRPKFKRKAR